MTGWYLLALMILSITFSIVICQISCDEVDARLGQLQSNVESSNQSGLSGLDLTRIRDTEHDKAYERLSLQLLYMNVVVLVVGGLSSYYFAYRSLLPIEKAHAAMSRFTGDASHELRTPLAVMKTELEVALRDETATANNLKDILSSNLEEVNNLTKLSEMLLSISHIDSTRLKLGPVNLDDAINKAIKGLRIPSTRIIIKSNEPHIIHANATAITDLVKILLDNAIQYSPKQSKILINISKKSKCAKLDITNSGIGISAETLPYIFDRFYRADSSRTNKDQKNYGLGLALAKNIVTLHNGSLNVSSVPNETTTFTLTLPLDHKKDI